jgi:hypothetical protein
MESDDKLIHLQGEFLIRSPGSLVIQIRSPCTPGSGKTSEFWAEPTNGRGSLDANAVLEAREGYAKNLSENFFQRAVLIPLQR